jgi:hypothetical protein
MNKFQKLIQASSKDTLNKRGNLLISSVQNKMEQKIFDIKNRINEVEMRVEQLTDVAPENTYDLRPGGKGFDPEKWINNLVSLKTELYTLSIELVIAEDIKEEWFEEKQLDPKGGENNIS